NKNLILQIRDQCAPFGNRRDDQWRFADGDRLSACFVVTRGVFNLGLNQQSRRALAERTPGEVTRRLEVKWIRPVVIGLALNRRRFKHGNIEAGNFDADLAAAHWLPEEVIRVDGSRYMVAGPVTTLCLVAFCRKINS